MTRNELARAITLAESTRPEQVERAQQFLDALLPLTGNSLRIGITGAPGAGKSTLIERLGLHIIEAESSNVAVLAVDPSSEISKGSLLGDKTRMPRLSAHPSAFVRSTAAGGVLGGVARSTRDALLLCEAAGYRNIIVETVGVGQSETRVHSIIDYLVLLLLPASGDELQGSKRGIVEMADLIAVNKADGALQSAAEATAAQYRQAVSTPVITCSAHTGTGIAELWSRIKSQGRDRRAQQSVAWLHSEVEWALRRETNLLLPELELDVKEGTKTPYRAAQELIRRLRSSGT